MLLKPKLLIGIMACHHRRPHLQAIRDTWLLEIKGRCDYKFFFGKGGHGGHPSDEIVLDCDDAYRGLACKVQESARYAYNNNYDWFFKVDDDTYVRPERVVRATIKGVSDYQGVLLGPTDHYHTQEYARGGTGYWLSRNAMKVLVDAPTPNPDIPSEYAEDSWVGKTLKSAGISCTNDDRLRCADQSGPNRGARHWKNDAWKRDVPTYYNDYITTCEFLGNEMLPVHAEWVESAKKHADLFEKIRVK